MVFRFDREKKAFVDKERKLLFTEAGMTRRPEDGVLFLKYRFQIEDSEFIRQVLHTDNDVYQDFSEERDKYNIRKYTVRLGDNPWIRLLTEATHRISGSAPWTYETEILFREAMYAFHTKRFPDHIDQINIQFGIMGGGDSIETFVPNHPVYEAED